MQHRKIHKLLLPSLLFTQALSGVWAGTASAATGDADNDGVADAVDEFPCRADVSSSVFVPAENGYATLYVEDQWPSQGDYDFNDLVLDYNVEMYKSGSNVKSVRLTFHPRAAGAAFNNGAAVHLPLTLSSVSGVQITRKVGSGSASVIQPIDGETDLVVKIADNIRTELFAGAAGTINTEDAKATAAGSAVEINITFSTPVALNTALAPFDVFLYRTDDYSHQIHRPQFAGTTRMRGDLFGTLDDGSNASKKFVDVRGVPFILDVPTTASFPKENTRIDALFPDIVSFGQSGGSSNQNFFSVNVRSQNAFGRSLTAAPTVGQIAGLRDSSCLLIPTIPANGLIAAYTFEESTSSANDIAAKGHTMTASTTLTRVAGPLSNSTGVRLGGSGQILSTPNTTLLAERNTITIALWMRPANISQETGLVVKGERGGSAQSWTFYQRGDELATFNNFPTRSTSAFNTTSTGVNLVANQWVHVAISMDAVNRVTKYYKNGVVVNTFALSAAQMPVFDALTTSLIIGSDAGAPNDYVGDLDDIYIWNRILSDAELANVASSTRPLGLSPATAQTSCKTTLSNGASFGNGIYFIDPDGAGAGAAFQAFCDMTTDGGGWTAFYANTTAIPWGANASNRLNTFDNFNINTSALNVASSVFVGQTGFDPRTKALPFGELAVQYGARSSASRVCLPDDFYKGSTTNLSKDNTLRSVTSTHQIIWDDATDNTSVTWCANETGREGDAIGVDGQFCAPYNDTAFNTWTTTSGGSPNICGGSSLGTVDPIKVVFFVR